MSHNTTTKRNLPNPTHWIHGRILRWLFWSLPLVLLIASCQKAEKVAYSNATLTTSSGTEYFAHEVIIRKSDDVSVAQLEAQLQKYGAVIVDKDARMAKQLGYFRVLLPKDTTSDVLISRLTQDGVTQEAERNYMVNVNMTPNDSLYASQWNMRIIQADKAWNITTGSVDVVVAVTDSGIDFNHADLKTQIWQNPNEIPGNGVDDDNNGYVDDVRGWDFQNKDNNPADDAGHGTAVSGVIGALGNNGKGVAGVGWDFRIMPLKFIGPSGSGSLWDAAEAILYAADNGVKIINASWGCSGCYSDYFVQVLDKMESKGSVLVAAAGNDGKNIDKKPQYPAAYGHRNIISVGASWKEDTPFEYSNWGKINVDVVAPGRQIPTTARGGGYGEQSGTSLAAPHVAGIMALYWGMNPDASADTVKQRLIATCDPVSELKYKSACEGRVNAYRMLTDDDEPPVAPENLVATPGERNDAILTWDPVDDAGLAMYICKWGLAPGKYINEVIVPGDQTTTIIENLEDGVPYYFACYAADKSGNISPPSNEATLLPKDDTVPPQVIDLQAKSLPGPRVSGQVHSSSSEASTFYQAENAYDGSPLTAWLAAPSPDGTEPEYLEIDFNLPTQVERVALTPVAAYPEFFPSDFDIELSMDGSSWTVVGGLRNVVVSDAEEKIEVFFPTQIAAHLRLTIHQGSAFDSGLAYTGIGELEAFEPAAAPDVIVLSFTAPGDDPGFGTAHSYDIRYATSPITAATFGDATPLVVDTPAASGIREEIRIDGLQPETTYWFAMTARDEVGNVSTMSNVVVGATATILPGTITDFEVVYQNNGSTYLTWNAPGNDGYTGQATSYALRWSSSPMDAASFTDAHPVSGITAPLPAGSNEMFDITSLQHPGQFLYFAIAAIDEKGHMGGISNVVSVKPVYDMFDTEAPAAITNLNAFYSLARGLRHGEVIDSSSHLQTDYQTQNLLDGDVLTMWMTEELPPTLPEWVTVDLGEVQSIDAFRMHPAVYGNLVPNFPRDFEIQVSADNVNWQTVVATTGQAAQMGQWLEWHLPIVSARYVKVHITLRGFASCNAPTECNQPSTVVISELEILGPTQDLDVDLQWIAPGDDGWEGTAYAYDLRHSIQPITAANFSAATQMSIKAPLTAGMFEVHTVPDLDFGEDHYFAIKSQDAAGNWSSLSNVAKLTAAVNPPAPVTDLSAVNVTKDAVELRWTAVGDDGLVGTADSYDIRYAKLPINMDNWHLANVLFDVPLPKGAGSAESLVVSGLSAASDYFFVLRVLDDEGGVSLFSNMVHFKTLTDTPPLTVSDLQAIPVDVNDSEALPLSVADVSSQYTDAASADMLIDGTGTGAWLTGQKSEMTPEYVELSLEKPTLVGDIRLLLAEGYEDMFPVDFQVQLKLGEGQWETVISENSFFVDDDAAGVEEWRIGGVEADRIRIDITRTAPSSFGYFAAIGEIEVFEAQSRFDTIMLSWTSPSVTDGKERATRYDIRHGGDVIVGEDAFLSATPVADTVLPRDAGMPEFMAVSGLAQETRYCFALSAVDSVGNRSEISNSPCAYTPGIPPAPVVDLRITDILAHSATLEWTASGADWRDGVAAAYELRVSTARINKSNWNDALVFTGLPAPSPAGESETFTVTGLAGDTEYYFAIVAIDGAGSRSGISNNARGLTGDDVAPLAITDLVTNTDFDNWGTLQLSWTAPGDSGPVGSADRYDIRVAKAPITEANFADATPATPIGLVPQAAGEKETLSLANLWPEREIFVAIKAADAEGNWSAISNVPSARTRDENPGRATDLEVVESTSYELGNAMVLLRWTAPGDDDMVGIANRYVFRYSYQPLDELNFESGIEASVDITPAPGTTVQMTTVNGLNEGVNYCFAFRAIDERDNVGKVSNSACTTTADGIAPAKIWDLKATTGASRGTVDLTWTHPGDDEMFGKAGKTDLRWSYAEMTPETFGSATPVNAQPGTGLGGTAAHFTATKLPDEVLLHFAIRAVDDAGNWSEMSNDASARTPDVAPAKIDDLKQTAVGLNSITLGWTAVGDDEYKGTATAYELRYSETPLSAINFDEGTAFAINAPLQSGSKESATITGLVESTNYYIGIRVVDDRGNWSPITFIYPAHTQDTIPPGMISPVDVRAGSGAGSLRLDWIATGDDLDVGTATRYLIRYASSCITPDTWAQASVVQNEKEPKPSGYAELFQIDGLAGEREYFVAVRAVDEVGNVGPVSPCAQGETAAVPPNAIDDLRGQATRPRSVILNWTAPFDVGALERAVSYDIRYATFKLTEGNFYAAATFENDIVPGNVGKAETATVPNLKESTLYYFAIKSKDDRGAVSAISNVVEVTTLDETPPAAPPAITANTTGSFTGMMTTVTAFASSQLVDILGADNILDGDANTMWVSDASSVPRNESITLDLGDLYTVDRIRLLPSAEYMHLFPENFAIYVSADNEKWTKVLTLEQFEATSADWMTFGFDATSTQYVRVMSYDPVKSYFGLYYSVISGMEVYASAHYSGYTTLTWTAPGDDMMVGTSQFYQVFYSEAAFDSNTLDSATAITLSKKPLSAHYTEAVTIAGTKGETRYYWAVRAGDEAGNIGEISEVVTAMSSDAKPAIVKDLRALAVTKNSVDLAWSASGDDGRTGVAAASEMRFAPWPLTVESFPLAELVGGMPAPAVAGTSQSVTVNGLSDDTVYYFAMVVTDEKGASSYLSNVAVVRTESGPDNKAPAAVTDLDARVVSANGYVLEGVSAVSTSEQAPAFVGLNVADGDLNTSWSTTAKANADAQSVTVDLGAVYPLSELRLWPDIDLAHLFPVGVAVRVSVDGLTWSTVLAENDVVLNAGDSLEAVFPVTAARFVEVVATELAMENNGLYYAVVAEVEVVHAESDPGTVVVTWTASGDDGVDGIASSYALQYSACPFDSASAQLATTYAPGESGDPELARITGLSSGTYCVAVTVIDDAGNQSPLSNVGEITIP
ncbi:MAG: discoidin domain-containing protein [Deltaproteobacteria bacterium]|nr:discoidin domain-containing protein [Deltaproteobacteria bacterium]